MSIYVNHLSLVVVVVFASALMLCSTFRNLMSPSLILACETCLSSEDVKGNVRARK